MEATSTTSTATVTPMDALILRVSSPWAASASAGVVPSRRSTSLKVGIFGAEPWTNDMRREMEERTDMHAVDIYGLSEVIGPGVASECVETKDGLHVWEDH